MNPEGKSKGTTSKKGRSRLEAALLESRLAYHLRCLREDATDPALTSLERLVLVRDRARRIREIRRRLDRLADGQDERHENGFRLTKLQGPST